MDCAAPAIQTPMDRIETIDPEKDGFNETKTYDLKFDSDEFSILNFTVLYFPIKSFSL